MNEILKQNSDMHKQIKQKINELKVRVEDA
jgi:hypothetical protein